MLTLLFILLALRCYLFCLRFCFQVPNIRFNVAKELATIAPVCGQNVYETQINPVLSVLLEDADQDVRFFAEKTLKILGNEFGTGGK
jgi:hypothetical protein